MLKTRHYLGPDEVTSNQILVLSPNTDSSRMQNCKRLKLCVFGGPTPSVLKSKQGTKRVRRALTYKM